MYVLSACAPGVAQFVLDSPEPDEESDPAGDDGEGEEC